jgi:hypothetical protein
LPAPGSDPDDKEAIAFLVNAADEIDSYLAILRGS